MTAAASTKINVVDLFAGCGGFTQGFHSYVPTPGERSPFRSIAAVEFDTAAAATYAVNFAADSNSDCKVFADDIKKWDPSPYRGEVDVILGGPPCQGFSGLGEENPLDPRNKLWREYVKVVSVIQPKIFVIENVDRFFRSAEYAALLRSNKKGLLRNYNLTEQRVLNAADYGVPQARRRAIVIATRKDLPRLDHPSPTHEKKGSQTGLFDPSDRLPWETVEDIFKKTATEPPTTELPERWIEISGRLFPGIFRTHELHVGRNPTELSLARYREIGPGENRNSLRGKTAFIDGEFVQLSTASWDRHTSGSGDVMGRLRTNSPAVTIRTEFFKPEKGRYLHPTADRPITHYEAALLQGFPEEFKWCGTKVQIARQIGNAVPVGLSRALARHIHNYLASASR
ncbi:DNA cytosine methyltransferase [Streptomyces sp. NPDC127584]|uniref:DNA cytosine methyltransferase n=1 Tax=Streptomyces sp. NPDC127584 TaxID=3345403 RepID=UPI0036261494